MKRCCIYEYALFLTNLLFQNVVMCCHLRSRNRNAHPSRNFGSRLDHPLVGSIPIITENEVRAYWPNQFLSSAAWLII